jgi:hypothetical protein
MPGLEVWSPAGFLIGSIGLIGPICLIITSQAFHYDSSTEDLNAHTIKKG